MRLLVALTLLLTATLALAQEGEGRPRGVGRMFGRLDGNGDGVIDAEEAQSIPAPVQEMIRSRGIDLSRGVTREQFDREASAMMGSGGFAPGGGPWGGGPWGGGGFDRRAQGGEGGGETFTPEGGGDSSPSEGFGPGGPGGFGGFGGRGGRGGRFGGGGPFGEGGGFGGGRFAGPGGPGEGGGESGGAGFGGGPPPWMQGGEGEFGGRRGRDRGAEGDNGRGPEGGWDTGREGGAAASRSGGPIIPGQQPNQKKPRVARELSQAFKDLDSNNDGQVGLYEWKKARRGTLTDFDGIDSNRDGFLTPLEIARKEASGLQLTNPAASIAAASTPGGTPAGSITPAPSGGAASTAPAEAAPKVAVAPLVLPPGQVDESSADAMQGRRYFGLLDSNKDGAVSLDEWKKSSRLKPLFENAGVDLNQPMSADQFVAYYVHVNKKT